MSTQKLLLHAAHVLTQDDTRTVLTDASIGVENGRIAAIGPRRQVERAFTADRVLDLGEALVMPGLVNAHTHAAMTFLRGMADDLPLEEWLTRHIFPIERHLTEEIVYYSSMLGYAEMLRTGTTSCLDMYIFTDAALRAARSTGLRCTVGEVIFSFPSAASPSWEHTLDMARDAAHRLRGEPRLGVMLCPHAVYTTPAQILRACADTAAACGVPLQLHLAETAHEEAQCREQYGLSPVAYAAELGLLRTGTSLAHVVHTTDADLDLLAAGEALVVHNPSSNMKLASGVARVPDMLVRGIATGLGTDGAASNNQLNMFMEMSRAALLHKVHGLDPTLASAQSVLDMATRQGAAALGGTAAADGLGQLRVGAPADIIALDATSPNLLPLYNPASHVIYAATGHEVFFTMVHGDIVYHNGAFTHFDYAALRREMDGIRQWALRKSQQ